MTETVNTMTIETCPVDDVRLSAQNPATAIRVWPDNYARGDHNTGEGMDQGDLLLWMSDADISTMERVKIDGEFFQLAPGNTQGSRHIVRTSDVEVYKPANFGRFVNTGSRERPAGFIMGYVLNVLRRTELRHPEHPWHELPCGVIQTAGQSDARTLEWSKD